MNLTFQVDGWFDASRRKAYRRIGNSPIEIAERLTFTQAHMESGLLAISVRLATLRAMGQ